MINKICDTFANEEENVLYTAMHVAAGCKDLVNDQETIYEFIEDTPRGSMTCMIVEALNKLGYKITKV